MLLRTCLLTPCCVCSIHPAVAHVWGKYLVLLCRPVVIGTSSGSQLPTVPKRHPDDLLMHCTTVNGRPFFLEKQRKQWAPPLSRESLSPSSEGGLEGGFRSPPIAVLAENEGSGCGKFWAARYVLNLSQLAQTRTASRPVRSAEGWKHVLAPRNLCLETIYWTVTE